MCLLFQTFLVLTLTYQAAARWPPLVTSLSNSQRTRVSEWISGADESADRLSMLLNGQSYFGATRQQRGLTTADEFLDSNMRSLELPDGDDVSYSKNSNYFRNTDLDTCVNRHKPARVSDAISEASRLLNDAHLTYMEIDWEFPRGALVDYSLRSAACSILIHEQILEKMRLQYTNATASTTGSQFASVSFPSGPGFATIAYEEGMFTNEKDTDFNDYVCRVRVNHVYERIDPVNVAADVRASIAIAYPGAPTDREFLSYVGTRVTHVPAARGSTLFSRLFFVPDSRRSLKNIAGIGNYYDFLVDYGMPFSQDGEDAFALDANISMLTHSRDDSVLTRVVANVAGGTLVYIGKTQDMLPVHEGLPLLQPARQMTNTLANAKVPRVYAAFNHTIFVANSKDDWSWVPATGSGADGYPALRLVLVVSEQPANSASVRLSRGFALNIMNLDRTQMNDVQAGNYFTLQGIVSRPGPQRHYPFRWPLEGYPIDNYGRPSICVQSAENVGAPCTSSKCAYGSCAPKNICINSNGHGPIIGTYNLSSVGKTCNVITDNKCELGICFSGKTPYYGFFDYVKEFLIPNFIAESNGGQEVPDFWKQSENPINTLPQDANDASNPYNLY